MLTLQPGENSLKSNTLEIIIKAKDLTGSSFKTAAKGIDGLKNSISRVTSTLFSLKTAFLGVGAGLLADDVIETKNEFVKYQKTLETLTGSTIKAGQAWEDLLEFAERTPFRINQVMESYKTLKAFGLDPTIETMTILGDTAAALGGRGVLGRIALVLGQIQAQGFMSAQDMNQLANAGINAGKIMKDTFGAARDEVMQLKDQGVDANMIINALLKNMKEKFGGQMAAMNRELSGQWEMLISIWERFTVSIMDSGLYDYLNTGLTLFNKRIIKLREEGVLDEWAEKTAIKIIASFEATVMGLAGSWDIAKPILEKLKESITGLWDWFEKLPGWVQKSGLILAIFGGIKAKLSVAFLSVAIPKIEELIKLTKEYEQLGGTSGVIGALRTYEEQLALVEKRIAKFREQIELEKKLIEQDKKNRDGWRGKIFGEKAYQKQLEKRLKFLKELEEQLSQNPYYEKLIKRRAILETIITSPKPEKKATEDVLNALGIPTGKELDNELSKTQRKIQALFQKIKELIRATKAAKGKEDEADTGGDKDPKNKPDQTGIPLSAVGKQKSILARLLADNTVYFKKLDQLFETGAITTKEYYDEQVKHSDDLYNKKVKLLNLELEKAESIDEKKAIEDSLYTLEKTHEAELLELKEQRIEAEDALLQKKQEAADLLREIKDRASASGGFGLESQFDQETAQMEARHTAELVSLAELTENKEIIADAARAQELEKEQLFQDQKKRIKEQELAVNAQIAGTMSNIMGQAYELSGKKAKAFFYAQKTLAIAEAIINANLAATKVMGQTGVFGIPLSAMIYAQAMMNVAMISAQTVEGYASGGEIKGHSPSKTADNIRINATAGEYMQPVDIVKYYGLRAMEAIRLKLVPREALNALISGFAIPAPDTSYKLSYATGGKIAATEGEMVSQEISITNIVDPRDIDMYMASSAGSNAVLNVISSRSRSIKRILGG